MSEIDRFSKIFSREKLPKTTINRIIKPLLKEIDLEIRYISELTHVGGQIPFACKGKKKPIIALIEKIRTLSTKRTGVEGVTNKLSPSEYERKIASGEIVRKTRQLEVYWHDLNKDELRTVILHLTKHKGRMNKMEDALSDFLLDSIDTYISGYSIDNEVQEKRGEDAIESEFEYLENKGGSFFDTKLSAKSDIDYEDFYKSNLDSPYYDAEIKNIIKEYKSKSKKQNERRRDILRETKLHEEERQIIEDREGTIFFGILIGLGLGLGALHQILTMRNRDKWIDKRFD